jgi:hypothetical protein
MEAKYKIGDKVDINCDNEILEVEVFGHVEIRKRNHYSLRSGAQFYFVEESEILERPNE